MNINATEGLLDCFFDLRFHKALKNLNLLTVRFKIKILNTFTV